MGKISRIINETIENIRTEKPLFISTLITLTVIFFIVNSFSAYLINVNKINDYVKENMQVKVFIYPDITKETIINLERKSYSYDEVKSVKFVSKNIALKKLSDSLKIDADYGENPLPDVMLLMVKEEIDLKNLKDKLLREDGVKSVDTKNDFIEKLNKFTKGLNKLVLYLSILIAIPIFIITFNLIHSSILYRKENIEIMSLVGATGSYIRLPFILEGLVNMFFGIVFSTIIFIPVYGVFISGVEIILPVISVASLFEVLPTLVMIVLGFGTIITLLASLLSMKIYLRIYGE